ncbi:unnamed protein product [Didymodactylos carnosus]|uniref:PLAT domain-containing protein n=1 Tax=Didymodactylos carnosus TaxID=1234261 RepID=A0A815KIA0_9BILA|nr:unnamed protein product [Didymodactylos carnosus]CAF1391472.1 unnamed protein product [Didymodactylos carnosus]CAF4189664.1 unnamed protein product [Didymodactylos carnosus]CAF4285962.1 unnamed protein product [Didymodactylos carnosus]
MTEDEPADIDPSGKVTYVVQTITADKRHAGTDGQVYLTLFGDNDRKTEEIHLDGGYRDNFERAAEATFELKLPDVGELKSIELRHHSKTPDIQCYATSSRGQWLGKPEPDKIKLNVTKESNLRRDSLLQHQENDTRIEMFNMISEY